MLSDDKLTSPIARSTEYVSIEESELGSVDYEDIDSITESYHQERTVSNFEIFLKIKPTKTKKILSIFNDNKKYYEILNSTTLITKFKPDNKLKNSRLSSTIVNDKKINEDIDKKFVFTKIYDSDTTQSDFFESIMKLRINDYLNGHNSTIICFGTTNSGKTYTLHGTPDQPGLIPRSIEYIFSEINCTLVPWYKLNPNNTLISLDDKERLEESEKKVKLLRSPIINLDKFTEARKSLENSEQTIKRDELNGESMYAVWLSFAEIYNENIYDLLDFEEPMKNRSLKLIGDKNGNTYIQGLTTIYVTTPFEACQILVAGQSRMSTAFTNLNSKSSRSHTIFTIGLLKYQKAYAPHETESSTLTFCDLAGSGRSKGLSDNIDRLLEAKNINKSLLVFGRCLKTIQKMQSIKQINEHVAGPFRESKLTRIFQRALSGYEQTTFLINLDFSSELINEIKSILKISSIARKIAFDIKKSKKSKEVNFHTSRTNESDNRHELKSLKSLNCNLNDTKTILNSDKNSTIRDESFDTSLNINDRIESIDCIGDIKNDKKCKIDELTYREDNGMFYKNLNEENNLEKSNKNDSNELNNYHDQIKSDISISNVKNDTFLNELKDIQEKKINDTQIVDLNDEDFNEITELKKQLIEKTNNIKTLTMQLESCEKELNETEIACKDAEDKNVILFKKIEKLEKVIKELEYERKDFSVPQPPLFLEEAFSSPFNDKSNYQLEENNYSLSSIMGNSFYEDDLNEPRIQAHVDTKKYNFKDIVKSFPRKNYSNVTDGEIKNILEVSGNDLRSSNASSKNDSGIITEESFDSKNYYSNINLEKDLNIKENKIVSFDDNLDVRQSNEKLKLNEDIDSIEIKCLESLTNNCKCLEDLSKWLKYKQNLQTEYCKSDHSLKLNELKNELSLKTIEINEANDKILTANRDLKKLHDFNERLNELTIVIDKYRKDKNDLYDELRNKTDIQLNLETKLKYLTSLMESKENDMKNLKDEFWKIFHTNMENHEKSKDIGLQVIELNGRMDAIRKKLIDSEEMQIEMEKKSSEQIEDLKNQLKIYKNDSTILLTRTVDELNEKKDELIRVKTQLLRKEREINLFKNNRDTTVKRYECLVKQLQDEIEKFKERSINLETSMIKKIKDQSPIKRPIRSTTKFKVSESIKKLTRAAKNSEGGWRPSYLRRKSIDEKSIASSSTFSNSHVSSSLETIVETFSENNSQLKKENKSINRENIIEEDNETSNQSSQTESDVDSNESDSPVTSDSSTRTKDYDSEDYSDEISCNTKRNRMTGWMRIRRIDARTVLPSSSDFQLDTDRSDS